MLDSENQDVLPDLEAVPKLKLATKPHIRSVQYVSNPHPPSPVASSAKPSLNRLSLTGSVITNYTATTSKRTSNTFSTVTASPTVPSPPPSPPIPQYIHPISPPLPSPPPAPVHRTSDPPSQWFEGSESALPIPTRSRWKLHRSKQIKENEAPKKRITIKPKEISAEFETVLPTAEQLRKAGKLLVYGPGGNSIRFWELIQDQKTIVCFIRHFWCPMCQDYMHSITRELDPEALRHARVKLIIISNGDPAMINPYLQISKAPVQLYTDPSLKLYDALGMNLRTSDFGQPLERGSYLRHGLVNGTISVIKAGLRVGMPLTKNGGDINQVGGEFIFGPSLKCSYAHRMTSTTSHVSIRSLLLRAGVPASTQPRDDEDEEETGSKHPSWSEVRRAEVKKLLEALLPWRERSSRPAQDCVGESCSVIDISRSSQFSVPWDAGLKHRVSLPNVSPAPVDMSSAQPLLPPLPSFTPARHTPSLLSRSTPRYQIPTRPPPPTPPPKSAGPSLPPPLILITPASVP
ncbi:hypothetical protein SISNIDRAFT_481242 [Sistotremastrum niveocremeum HHB9708]|uniref:Thioredoxin domain-containing protein n=1 Tax=Sistotremastrum niveocremeum HHB9708 TaxID=1314777 RepID=A0A165A5Q1_9AGAM|nr:hypothetical protein SISNIDRAFT_481242 [Sistotremastrum niveocremeum HHB9708]